MIHVYLLRGRNLTRGGLGSRIGDGYLRRRRGRDHHVRTHRRQQEHPISTAAARRCMSPDGHTGGIAIAMWRTDRDGMNPAIFAVVQNFDWLRDLPCHFCG